VGFAASTKANPGSPRGRFAGASDRTASQGSIGRQSNYEGASVPCRKRCIGIRGAAKTLQLGGLVLLEGRRAAPAKYGQTT
jgi:hypothetical protein